MKNLIKLRIVLISFLVMFGVVLLAAAISNNSGLEAGPAAEPNPSNPAVLDPLNMFSVNVIYVDYHRNDVNYRLVRLMSVRHVWVGGAYYDLAVDMRKYLYTGPRISEISDIGGYVKISFKYKIGSVFMNCLWKFSGGKITPQVTFYGGSSWKTLIFVDADVWDNTNYAFLPSTGETINYERKITGTINVDVKEPGHSQYARISPRSQENPAMWILKYGYFGNNPDTALNNEYIYNQNIIIYYQGTSSSTAPSIWNTP